MILYIGQFVRAEVNLLVNMNIYKDIHMLRNLCLLFTVRLAHINSFTLGYGAHWTVGMNHRGDLVLCKQGGKDLIKYLHIHDGEYRQDICVPLPRDVRYTYYKEVCDDGAYLQQSRDTTITYHFKADLKTVREHHNKGLLRGILPPNTPIYAEEDGDGVIVRVSDKTLKPPSGAWRESWLSVCFTAHNIIVTDRYEEVLDVFTREGKNSSYQAQF